MEETVLFKKAPLWKRPTFYIAILLCLFLGFISGAYWSITYGEAHRVFLTISAEEARTAGTECIRSEIAKNDLDCPWNETTAVTRSVAFDTGYLLYVETDHLPSGYIFVHEKDGKNSCGELQSCGRRFRGRATSA